MRRATAEPLEPQDLETEGERQLRALLQNQLDTRASLQGCVSKRARFAPGVVYQPFGERAAGTLTLYQFRDLQEREGERDALRELGLSDPEIQLWRDPESAGKAAPDAVCRRLAALQEKVAERRRVLALPQRFAGSKRLNRRQMEIERALFQGTDRHGFLRALYHQGEEGSLAPTLPAGTEEGNLAHMLPTGTEEWSPIHTVAIGEETLAQTLPLNTNEGSLAQTLSASMEKRRLAQVVPATTERSLAQAPAGTEEGRLAETPTGIKDGSLAQTLSALEKRSRVLPYQEERLCLTLPAGRTLASLGSGGRVGSVREAVVSVSEEEILQNRASLEEIRSLARCRDYRAGEPSAVTWSLSSLGSSPPPLLPQSSTEF
ncbi:RNA-binding protein 41 isoform X2 [Ascaphus truei]|uniref:RNA-binding protein 41 isoform X2 n=1 Tax=Ascaphus truei TaxID=8439 RepID=UPI003F5960CD